MEPKHFESLYPDTVRDEEIDQIVTYIREGGSSQLVGITGAGKSNLLGLLSYNHGIHLKHFPKNNAWVHFIKVDFSEIRGRVLQDALKLLFLALTDSLRERKMEEEYEAVNTILKESLVLQDEMVLSQGLKRAVEYLSVEKKLTLIFLFNRFEEYIPSLTSDFFTQLRLLRDIAKYRFSVIFSVNRPLEDTLDHQTISDFSEFFVGHTVFLRLYDPEAVKFRISYLEKMTGKTLAPGLFDEIITLTGGHGKLVKLSCEAVLADGTKPENLKDYLLGQRSIRQALLEIWKGLTPSEQQFLEGSHSDGADKDYLEKTGLIQDGRLAVPLLTSYLDDSSRIENTQKAAIVFNKENNAICKGEMVLSDTLTKAEFRLLRYLLEHPDAVVDREEIVNAVWQETATTAGVTDQAIDQLVFRLRRKIEEDPNNPHHLVTVKGRGIRFSPSESAL